MKRGLFALICFFVIAFPACNSVERENYYSIEGFALGTTYRFIVHATDTVGLRRQTDSLLTVANASMSIYQQGSLINRLNSNQTDSVDVHIAHCIQVAEKVSSMCAGVYDITIKPLTQAWGFTGHDPTLRPNVDSLLQYVGYEKIRVENGRLIKEHPGVQIELNSVAKGYIVDLMGGLMASRGINDYLVEIGGEIVCRGKNSRGGDWIVAIDRPAEGNYIPGAEVQVKLSITGRGLATSGNYRKFYYDADGQKVVHTINAVTGQSSPSNLLSATALAEDCATADALGTMMMVLGLEASKEFLATYPQYLGYLVYVGEQGEMLVYSSPQLQKMIVD